MIPKLYASVEAFLSTLQEMLSFDETDQHVSRATTYSVRRNILGHISDDLRAVSMIFKNLLKIQGLSVVEVAKLLVERFFCNQVCSWPSRRKTELCPNFIAKVMLLFLLFFFCRLKKK